jgi:hypothetical protein
MQGGVFVGVDGGTGDMEAVVVDSAGRVLGRGTGGPSNDPEVVGRMDPHVDGHIAAAIRPDAPPTCSVPTLAASSLNAPRVDRLLRHGPAGTPVAQPLNLTG